ncbi:MAG: iron complex transport system permease protein [Thermococcaceae archaeon]|jgi:iron complex transport system permease protein|uniref:Iron-siderophore ABC transporter permease n=1 Tax=Thermococcus sibiricus TaxID=172049 RepID=A0A101EJZ4_9EURY|nr:MULTISPECIES: iron ABC transporter permease [Thermococcus]KUK16760.1 MAG: Iron-siderophore ABC transporter permease [Thermococcus sibiricus]MCA6213662.1 iron ABC transporter permease [Thermococcus bergensis]MDK2782972.1 iron complex transport system permease protein [Thermococcaceae archaeon]MDN5321104.1 iron complex transport system permease protein [Thermococcaceae archaeon]
MEYREYTAKRVLAGIVLLLLLLIVSIYAISHGGYELSAQEIYRAMVGKGDEKAYLVVWNIRLPRVIAGILVGASLAVSGAVMQGVLRNPLASPFTMGVSHGAMFGASLAIILGAGYSESSGRVILTSPYTIVLFAFLGAISATLIILSLAKLRGLSPEAIILAGVAMSALFTALTTLVQYLADELQLAAMVYWSFGDIGRATWRENTILVGVFAIVFGYFILRSWDLNAAVMGDDVAKSVGIEIEKVRLTLTFLATLATATSVAFVGVIGFVGLIAPHMVRLLFGEDYRFLIPLSCLLGGLLLLTADTLARLTFSPMTLPVGVVTSFLGAPMFIYLLIRMEGAR